MDSVKAGMSLSTSMVKSTELELFGVSGNSTEVIKHFGFSVNQILDKLDLTSVKA